MATRPASDLAAEEIAAIKAENSRAHRAAQTVRNLAWALVATLAVVLFLVFVVVRPDPAPAPPIDYRDVASQAQGAVDVRLASPELPAGWSANEAELRTTSDGVQSWYIGFLTPSSQFIAFNQGIGANPSWVDDLLEGRAPTGSAQVVFQDWTEYDYRTAKDPGNVAYALVGDFTDSTLVLNGTANDEEFDTLATAILNSLGVVAKSDG